MVYVEIQEQEKINVPDKVVRQAKFPLTQPFCSIQVFN